MWQRPGYSDVLAGAEPGIREGRAEAGVPPGFEDAIGWLLPRWSWALRRGGT